MEENQTLLKCSSCKQDKLQHLFYKDSSRKNLISKRCIECDKLRTKNKKTGRELVRDKVRSRDGYTCQECGLVRTPEMVAEHNKKLTTLKGRIKSLDIHHLQGLCGKKSRKYDSMSDINLLITLCHKCHFNRTDHSSKSYSHPNHYTLDKSKLY